ncbi:Protein of unknown function DUF1628 [Methanosalsum zhilinae DSM 4017]|uniref:Archaeal Type IV pilin N-terminal domain-containing protein n=1 Tax=Methanosalsum zhilinae (strain DSM 4017 / NBRC 107636 / OCM 62 / WeN5) TaxID=679901 RepID=F7XMW3_METZD|nr:type IV pilin N-terminal domain-containing protein [Methanosalsum zhilinae]AEH59980.1 Protein of unknown function DUF1628 [Methanosalsum zhilinae DSM 4017]
MLLKNSTDTISTTSPSRSCIRTSEHAVSDVVGTILMVTITVIMASLISMSVFAINPPPDVPQINYNVQNNGSLVDLVHMGGEPVEVSDLRFIHEGQEINISNISQINETGTWRIGTVISLDADTTRIVIVHIPSQELIR